MNRPITPLLLLDFVLREENKFKNKQNIEVGSFDPEQVCMIHQLNYDEAGYVFLWTKDFHAEKFISYFKLNSLKDLDAVTLEDLWAAYLDGKGMLRCGICDERYELDFRIIKGQTKVSCKKLRYSVKTDELIDSLEKTQAYLLKHFAAVREKHEAYYAA